MACGVGQLRVGEDVVGGVLDGVAGALGDVDDEPVECVVPHGFEDLSVLVTDAVGDAVEDGGVVGVGGA